ncbi:MAG TPA: DinB family protein [Cellvibrionaceae bacterium]|nr:DinB family protein [Cellvibrionaceae bacterium]HMW50289.1 DinB family protein [Cellvibrionaceae bacterium]HNG61017.1 DinB family protein [Cellvibrionaceae bacterium]
MLKADCEIFANYNGAMNKSIYTCAAQLDALALELDRGAFFGSILGTLNHIMVADIIWLKRFANHPARFNALQIMSEFPTPKALNEILYSTLAPLLYQRRALDNIIGAFVQELNDEVLASALSYKNLQGDEIKKNLGFLLLHFFNHQTHHRGQLTTLFSQLGIDVGVTDLFVCIPSA